MSESVFSVVERLKEKVVLARDVPDSFEVELLGERLCFARPRSADDILEMESRAESMVKGWQFLADQHIRQRLPVSDDMRMALAKILVASKDGLTLDVLLDIYHSIGAGFYVFLNDYVREQTSVDKEVGRIVDETGKP